MMNRYIFRGLIVPLIVIGAVCLGIAETPTDSMAETERGDVGASSILSKFQDYLDQKGDFENNPDAVGFLAIEIEKADEQTRGKILEVATDTLLDYSQSRETRLRSCFILNNMIDPAALPALQDAMIHDPDSTVRESAAMAISKFGTTEAHKILTQEVEFLTDDFESTLEHCLLKNAQKRIQDIETQIAKLVQNRIPVFSPDIYEEIRDQYEEMVIGFRDRDLDKIFELADNLQPRIIEAQEEVSFHNTKDRYLTTKAIIRMVESYILSLILNDALTHKPKEFLEITQQYKHLMKAFEEKKYDQCLELSDTITPVADKLLKELKAAHQSEVISQ